MARYLKNYGTEAEFAEAEGGAGERSYDGAAFIEVGGDPRYEIVTSVVPGVAYVKETKKVAYNRPGSNARRGKHA